MSNTRVVISYQEEGNANSEMAYGFPHMSHNHLAVHASFRHQDKRLESNCYCSNEAAPSWMQRQFF